MWRIPFILIGCTPEPEAPLTCAESGVDGVDGRMCTIAGIGANCNNGLPSSALETCLFLPSAAAFDPSGRFVLDDFNNWRILALGDHGGFERIAGNGLHEYAPDGAPAVTSPLENPVDILYAPDGTLYLSELHGARVLRIVDGLIDTYVGSELSPGYPGYAGDGGPAVDAQMSESFGIAMGENGTLYIADSGNDCIRMVTPDGVIDTLAGFPPPEYSAATPPVEGQTLVDGRGSSARFRNPWGLAVDGDWLYVADAYNNAIRRVDVTTGEVVTVAGTGVAGFSGDGGPAVDAQLTEPVGVTVGPDGLLYIADSKNHVIRVIDAGGLIHTILGDPQVAGFEGDNTAPDEGAVLLNWPNDVVFSPDGDMYVIDTWNGAVRKIRRYFP